MHTIEACPSIQLISDESVEASQARFLSVPAAASRSAAVSMEDRCVVFCVCTVGMDVCAPGDAAIEHSPTSMIHPPTPILQYVTTVHIHSRNPLQPSTSTMPSRIPYPRRSTAPCNAPCAITKRGESDNPCDNIPGKHGIHAVASDLQLRREVCTEYRVHTLSRAYSRVEARTTKPTTKGKFAMPVYIRSTEYCMYSVVHSEIYSNDCTTGVPQLRPRNSRVSSPSCIHLDAVQSNRIKCCRVAACQFL